MFWANRTGRVVGATLLALPVLSIVGFAGAGPIAEIDPFARGDVGELLHAIRDHRVLFTLSLVPFVVTDVIVLPTVAATLYVTFRDRSQTLALVGAFAILVGTVAFVIHEVGAMTLAFLASDLLVQGGPAGVVAEDPIVLMSARTVSIAQGLAALCGQSATGFGLGAIGVLLLGAPEGKWNPPRWLGALGVAAALGMASTWLFLVNHTAGGIATLVGETATIVMVVILGVWFLRQPVPPAS